ncbi:MAG: type II toxin-antitoxin system prevent-host-death family antitoxin [Amaricoccus sp.]|uniref:type II toxin-antitoxin system Phd/YefM family antitoxin n=1 Tax=Amaricoccus sp. TaxID=1872485 RepID=UPI0039E70B95
MKQVNIHEAKTHLSRLVEAAARGEPFVIAKAGKPLVKVVPLEEAEVDAEAERVARAKRRIGFLEGQFRVPDDFDTFMQDEIVAMFDGKYKGALNPEFSHLEPKPFDPDEFKPKPKAAE